LELKTRKFLRITKQLITAVPAIDEAVAALACFQTRSPVAAVEPAFARRTGRAVCFVALVVTVKVTIAALLTRNTEAITAAPLVFLQAGAFLWYLLDALINGRAAGERPAKLTRAAAVTAAAPWVILISYLNAGCLGTIASRKVGLQKANFLILDAPFPGVAFNLLEGAHAVGYFQSEQPGTEDGTDFLVELVLSQATTGT